MEIKSVKKRDGKLQKFSDKKIATAIYKALKATKKGGFPLAKKLSIEVINALKKEKIRHYWQLSIRNQIHGTVILISVLSFLIIGIATILFFISRYQNSNREKLQRYC